MNTEFDSDLDLLSQTLPAVDASPMAGAEPFRMRCPNCKKLYSVEAPMMSGGELTKFECVDCQTSFFAMRPEFHGARFLETHELETQFAPLESSLPTIDGFAEDGDREPSFELERAVRSSVVQVPVASRECPNCHTLNALSNRECTKCEIIFAQFRPDSALFADDVEFTENAELVLMWQDVRANYQDIARHEAFLDRCSGEQQLTYAAHKYAQILMAAPQESIARLMRARIQGMISYGFDARENGMGWSTWSFPLPSFNNFIIFLGAVLVVFGLLGPAGLRHVAGLGFAMIALAIGLRVFLRRPR